MKNFAKYLGIMIDSDLSWKYHIDFIHQKISRLIGIVAKIKDVYYMASCLRDWKQVQSKRFDNHLTGVRK